MYRRFLNVNTGNAIKIFDAGGLKVTRAVPEKQIINFFWPYMFFFAFQRVVIPKKIYNFDTFLTGLCHFGLYENTFFVKHQSELYLFDVRY